jgi:hypothetical protein
LHIGQDIGINIHGDANLGVDTGFFFGNVNLSLELWTVISGISGFDD